MPEELFKLRPDRDLQCYFRRPSAVAALSGASETGFTVSGSWREQFDWAVVEWNRDNTFEHPLLRNLPDGDLRGLTLSYVESRNNCHAMDSDLFPFVDWPFLRIWATDANGERVYKVRLRQYAEPAVGTWSPASAEFVLESLPAPGEYVGIAWLSEHFTYQVLGADTATDVVQQIVLSVNAFSTYMAASQDGNKITLRYLGVSATPGVRETSADSRTGANGNRVAAYAYATGVTGSVWNQESAIFTGGVSPSAWRVTLPFDGLADDSLGVVPMDRVRKIRWTYAAAQQYGVFGRSEFDVRIDEWTVTGTKRGYRVASPESFRVEDNSKQVRYTGAWSEGRGNFSGGTIRSTTSDGASLQVSYEAQAPHELYLGSRLTFNGGSASVVIDGGAAVSISVLAAGDDTLARLPLGHLSTGVHQVTITFHGTPEHAFYFDFLEIAYATATLPTAIPRPTATLATDWDTDHSLALPAERSAWLIRQLGFQGRVNHYVGALVFYELHNPTGAHASRTITLSGTPPVNGIVSLLIGTRTGGVNTTIDHLIHPGSTPENIVQSFAFELNRGATALGATAAGNALIIWARSLGAAGDDFTATMVANLPGLSIDFGDGKFGGGADGLWLTDLAAAPRINRACRDWTRAFLTKCREYGLDAVSAFSTELQHGDTSLVAGIAQRYYGGTPVVVQTPATQTNFSPQSIAYWREVYRDAAQLHVEAGLQPYLQFGEVQWWYFAYGSEGMPFYDAYTKSTFTETYGRDMRLVLSPDDDPASFTQEVAHLANLIGAYTDAIMSFVKATYPTARFEVLYPTDVNQGRINKLVNYPAGAWTPSALECLKTEAFGTTASGDIDRIRDSVLEAFRRGFAPQASSHLVGIGDPMMPWMREATMAERLGQESVVLFALDQFCLVGYPLRSWAEPPTAVVTT